MNSKRIASIAKSAVQEKKGLEPVLLDIRNSSDVADYFLIVAGTSDRHVRTLADAVIDGLEEKGESPNHVEGKDSSTWILVDYGDVIVHVFHHEQRKFYNLERLWGKTKVIRKKRKKKHEKSARPTRKSSTA